MNFKQIFKKEKPIIVAEVGNNHEGNFNKAINLIDAATESGADAVKFQTYKIESYYNKKFTEKRRFKRLKKFQLTFDQFERLSNYSKKKKIIFYSTPFDIESAIFLNKIQKLFKISSGDNNFYPLIKLLKSFNKPTIISTGLLNYLDIKKITKYFHGFKNKLAILHCVSSYPAKDDILNMKSVSFLQEKFPKFKIGYSDHSLSTDSCKIAIMLGAFMVEKHFTLDKNTSNFHDHKISADPKELKNLVNFSKNFQSMLGNYKKSPKIEEIKNKKNLRRSLYFKKDMSIGNQVLLKDIVWLRPFNNFSIKNPKEIGKKRLKKNVKKGDLIIRGVFK